MFFTGINSINTDQYPLSEEQASLLRSASHINELRQKKNTVSQKIRLGVNHNILWPLLSDTDFLNQKVGMYKTLNFYQNRGKNGLWMHAKTKNGGFPVAYEETPYEWSSPHQYVVERLFSKGPLKYLSFGVDLESLGDRETEVTCTISFVSYLPVWLAKRLIQKEISKFMSTFQELEQRILEGAPALKAYFNFSPHINKQVQKLITLWQEFDTAPEVLFAFADYVMRAPERLVYRLRPYAIAPLYQISPLEVLNLCLKLTKADFLTLNWDCRCPNCQGPKRSFREFNELKVAVKCDTCAIQYRLDFEQHLELSFQPAFKLRKAENMTYCAGSPGNTPHIVWQSNFFAGEERSLTLDLVPGKYILRSLSLNNETLIKVSHKGQDVQCLNLEHSISDENGRVLKVIELKPQATLHCVNASDYTRTLILENTLWDPQTVSAARAQSIPLFQELFPDQILPNGHSLPLTNLIFLLIRSDTLPAEVGALIFQNEGAFLPDEQGGLGIFSWPQKALDSALELSRLSPGLRLSMNEGPAYLNNTEGHLYYSGEGYEKTRFAMKYSEADALVMGDSFQKTLPVERFIEKHNAQCEQIEELKLWRIQGLSTLRP